MEDATTTLNVVFSVTISNYLAHDNGEVVVFVNLFIRSVIRKIITTK